MREGVTEVRAGLSQKHALNVGRNSGRQNAVQFGTHLLEQRRYRSILLRLSGVIEDGDIVPIGLQRMSQRVFQQRRDNVDRADEVSLKEARVSACKSAHEVGRNEWAVLQKGDEDIVRNEMLFKNRMSGRLDLPRSYQLPANDFALCDLLTNGGIVSTIAEATTLRAMDDLTLTIQVPAPEQRRQWMFLDGL